MIVYNTRCCAAKELDQLGRHDTPEDALASVLDELLDGQPAFITFTGVTLISDIGRGHLRSARTDNYGEAFADYLRRNQLGNVVAIAPRINPNSGNTVGVWVWSPDYMNLRTYAAALTQEITL